MTPISPRIHSSNYHISPPRELLDSTESKYDNPPLEDKFEKDNKIGKSIFFNNSPYKTTVLNSAEKDINDYPKSKEIHANSSQTRTAISILTENERYKNSLDHLISDLPSDFNSEKLMPKMQENKKEKNIVLKKVKYYAFEFMRYLVGIALLPLSVTILIILLPFLLIYNLFT